MFLKFPLHFLVVLLPAIFELALGKAIIKSIGTHVDVTNFQNEDNLEEQFLLDAPTDWNDEVLSKKRFRRSSGDMSMKDIQHEKQTQLDHMKISMNKMEYQLEDAMTSTKENLEKNLKKASTVHQVKSEISRAEKVMRVIETVTSVATKTMAILNLLAQELDKKFFEF